MSDEELSEEEFEEIEFDTEQLKSALTGYALTRNFDDIVPILKSICNELMEISYQDGEDEFDETITELIDANVMSLFFSNTTFFALDSIRDLSTDKTIKYLCTIGLIPMLCQFTQSYINMKSDKDAQLKPILEMIETTLDVGYRYPRNKQNEYLLAFQQHNVFDILYQIQFYLANNGFKDFSQKNEKWIFIEKLTSFIMSKNFKDRIRLLVFGHSRTVQTDIPDVINQIIVMFYCPQFSRSASFDCFNQQYFAASTDKMTITPLNNCCSAFLIYLKSFEPYGYNKGIHYLSIHMNNVPDCYGGIGVISKKNELWTQGEIGDYFYKTSSNDSSIFSSYFRINDGLAIEYDRNWIITIKLNCDDWTVECYKNEQKFKTQNIKPNLSYYFALTLCGNSKTIFRIVKTPKLDQKMKPLLDKRKSYETEYGNYLESFELSEWNNPYYLDTL